MGCAIFVVLVSMFFIAVRPDEVRSSHHSAILDDLPQTTGSISERNRKQMNKDIESKRIRNEEEEEKDRTGRRHTGNL